MRYLIPKQRTVVETKVKNSRFIASLEQADSVEQAKALLTEARRVHPGANHHVYAFKIGYGASVIEGMSDDGEPSGTSGPPVMAVLRGSGAGDAVLIVTRYFGGTKLGTGGLVSAYKEAAQAVVAATELVEKIEKARIFFSLDYALWESVQRIFPDYELTVLQTDYGQRIEVKADIAAERLDGFGDFLQEISAGRSRPIVEE